MLPALTYEPPPIVLDRATIAVGSISASGKAKPSAVASALAMKRLRGVNSAQKHAYARHECVRGVGRGTLVLATLAGGVEDLALVGLDAGEHRRNRVR